MTTTRTEPGEQDWPDDNKLSGAVRGLQHAVDAIDNEANENLEDPEQVAGREQFRKPLLAAARLVLERW